MPTKSPHRLWGQAGIPATPASTVEGAFRKARPRSSRQKKPKKQENQENPQRVLLQYQEQQEEQKDSSYLCDPLLFQSSYQDFDYQQHHGTLKFYQPLTPLSDGQYFDQQQEANFDFYELITFHNSEYLDPELALC